jgi:hypothetical protein
LWLNGKVKNFNRKIINPTWFGLSNRLTKKLEALLKREKHKKKKEGIASLLKFLEAVVK